MQTILKYLSSMLIILRIHKLNAPLAHYFLSKLTDTSCSASQRANQRSSRWTDWEQTPSLPPHMPFRRPFCLPLFSLCLAGDEYSTPLLLLLQWAARNARANKKSWHFYSIYYDVSLSYHRPCVSDSHIQHPSKIKTDRSILHDTEVYLGHCYCA